VTEREECNAGAGILNTDAARWKRRKADTCHANAGGNICGRCAEHHEFGAAVIDEVVQ
jgi:hypothetical protein